MPLTDKQYEEVFHKIETFGKNANERIRYLAMHLNDTRSSTIDRHIEAQTDITFALMHYEKIVEMVKSVGIQFGLKV